jgi:hypothetical protein
LVDNFGISAGGQKHILAVYAAAMGVRVRTRLRFVFPHVYMIAEKSLDFIFGAVIRMWPAPDQVHWLAAGRTRRTIVRAKTTRLFIRHGKIPLAGRFI